MGDAAQEFSPSAYRRLLRSFADAGYESRHFEDIQPDRPHLALRHDIDYSVELALKVAQWDAQAGFSADFYFLVDTHFYNVAESTTRIAIKRIAGLGHRIGLHFDVAAVRDSDDDLTARITADAQLLSTVCEQPVDILSFHRPSGDAHAGRIATTPLRHPRDSAHLREIPYFSDSRGCFRFGVPSESAAFTRRHAIQLLLHPIWWTIAEPTSPVETLRAFLNQASALLHSAMAANSIPFADSLEKEDSALRCD